MIAHPIPLCQVETTEPLWLPFVQRIAERTGFDLEEIVGNIRKGCVELIVGADETGLHVLVGAQYTQRGKELLGDLIWITGLSKKFKAWTALFPDLERYLKSRGCTGIRAFPNRTVPDREGWQEKILARHGYKLTHVTLEKDFRDGK